MYVPVCWPVSYTHLDVYKRQHVYDLTMALAELGQEVHLVTSGSPGIPELEIMNGVRVYRVNPYQVSSPDFVTWVTQLNVAMIERCITSVSYTHLPSHQRPKKENNHWLLVQHA